MKFEDKIRASPPSPMRCYKCRRVLNQNIYDWDFDEIGAICIPFCHRKFKDGVGA